MAEATESTFKQYKAARSDEQMNRGPVEAVTVTMSDNDGFIVNTSYRPKPSKGGQNLPWPKDEKTVHPTLESVMEHIAARLGTPKATKEKPEKK